MATGVYLIPSRGKERKKGDQKKAEGNKTATEVPPPPGNPGKTEKGGKIKKKGKKREIGDSR